MGKPKKPLHEYPDKQVSTALRTHIGIDVTRRNTCHVLDSSTAITAAGNAVLFVNLDTGDTECVVGPEEGGGIGCVAVHPSKSHYVVCEKREQNPLAIVHQNPSRNVAATLRGGALRGFSACTFNKLGDLLATVAIEPDFVLTIWNWASESIVLRNKGFGADIFTVAFSPFSSTSLVTSGLGHIKFWSMAQTFTGLKLQGDVGKFGRTEISDVYGFAILPDGKVVSGSESGALLLWEGGLIKCELWSAVPPQETELPPSVPDQQQSGRGTGPGLSTHGSTVRLLGFDHGAEVSAKSDRSPSHASVTTTQTQSQTPVHSPHAHHVQPPEPEPEPAWTPVLPHEGPVDVVRLVEDDRVLMTAGHDGQVRYWSLAEIDVAENQPDGPTMIHCLKTLRLPGVEIRTMSLSPDESFWVITDGKGAVTKAPRLTLDDTTGHLPNAAAVLSPQAAGTVGSQNRHFAEGMVKLHDSAPAIRCSAGPLRGVVALRSAQAVVTGGDDGVLRLLDAHPSKRCKVYGLDTTSPIIDVQLLKGDPSGTDRIITAHGDGSLRLVRVSRGGFDVLSEVRPHAVGVVAMAVDVEAQRVYTFAEDKTAFFVEIRGGDQLHPVGYCELPERATCAEWLAGEDTLVACLVGFASGSIIALDPPVPGEVDSETHFGFKPRWSAIGYRQKQKPPMKEKKVPLGVAAMDAPDAQQSSSDDDDLDDEADTGPWAVNFIRRLPQGGFAIGMDAPELAYHYNCTKRYGNNAMGPPPLPPSGLEPAGWVEEPISNIAFRDTIVKDAVIGVDGKTLLLTTQGSGVLLRPLAKMAEVEHAAQLHDKLHDGITGAAVTSGGDTLFTIGDDGVVFAHSVRGAKPVDSDVEAVLQTMPAPRKGTAATAIAASVQRQKELDDQHAAEEAALGKKELMRRKIQRIHKQLADLLSQNDAEQGGRRVPDGDMVLDPSFAPVLEARIATAVADAGREYEWQMAKKKATVAKLRSHFVDNLLHDHFAVHAFGTSVVVASFRTPKFNERQEKALRRIEELLDAGLIRPGSLGTRTPASPTPAGSPGSEFLSREPSATPGSDAADPSVELGGSQQPLTGTRLGGTALGGTRLAHSTVKSQLEKAEERKRERIDREKGYETLLRRDPTHVPQDPERAAEVAAARNHMGDYTLKTSPGFSIPEQLRPTAERKARQLILLEHSVQQLRCEFNDRLLEMRDAKKRLCDSLNSDRKAVREICEMLKMTDDAPFFALRSEEKPEERFSADREVLARFEEEQEKALKRQQALELAKKGFGADLATMDEDEEEEQTKDGAQGAIGGRKESMGGLARGKGHRRASQAGIGLTGKDFFENDMRARLSGMTSTPLQEDENKMVHKALHFRKERLERRIEKAVMAFDESLNDLFHEKLKLESDLCMADMRVLLLYREFLLLKDFKKRDDELDTKLEAYLAEKQELRQRSAGIMERCSIKAGEIDVLRAATDTLKSQFAELMAREGIVQDPTDKPPFTSLFGQLNRFFMKRLKRSRRGADDEEDEEDDSSSSSSEDEDEEDDIYADDGEEEFCPAGTTEEIFEAVLALRERRLDEEDRQVELKKAADQLAKEHSVLATKEQKVDKAIGNVEKDIEAFQVEKQHQLNQLETIVVLKLSQLRCLTEDGKLPDKFGDHIVVFSEDGLERLRQRIGTLKREKLQLDRDHHELLREASRLLRRKTKRTTEKMEMEAKVFEVMLLKFGQRVDLEMLENLSVDRETEELKALLRAEELRAERELAKQTEKLVLMKQQQQQRVAENTVALQELGTLRADQRTLETMLSQSAAKVVGKMSGGSKVATAADRAHLKDLVVAQQQEVDLLKAEIAMLRRKGGHVYTPVVNATATAVDYGTMPPEVDPHGTVDPGTAVDSGVPAPEEAMPPADGGHAVV